MTTPIPEMRNLALEKTTSGSGSFAAVGGTNPYIIPPKGITQATLTWHAGHDLTVVWGPNGAVTSGSYSIKTFDGKVGVQTVMVEIVKKSDVGAFWITTSNLPSVDIGKPVGLRMITFPLDN